MTVDIPLALRRSLEVTKSPRVLLVRHSDRPHIETGSAPEMSLNETGRRRASALGDLVGAELHWALSSPYRRCIETARLVGVEPEPSPVLGSPGPFVIDPDRGGEVFEQHGNEVMVRGQIEGKTWGCMRPLEEGTRLLFDTLLERLARHGTSGLAVTHDAIVLPSIAWVTGDRFADRWIDFLDGCVLTPGHLTWNGRTYEVPA